MPICNIMISLTCFKGWLPLPHGRCLTQNFSCIHLQNRLFWCVSMYVLYHLRKHNVVATRCMIDRSSSNGKSIICLVANLRSFCISHVNFPLGKNAVGSRMQQVTCVLVQLKHENERFLLKLKVLFFRFCLLLTKCRLDCVELDGKNWRKINKQHWC